MVIPDDSGLVGGCRRVARLVVTRLLEPEDP